MTETAIRAELRAIMQRAVSTRSRYAYTFSRPLPVIRYEPPPTINGKPVIVRADCSWAVKLWCRWTGVLPDPTNLNWSQWGNSESMWRNPHLAHIPIALIRTGDIVAFGEAGDDHAAMVIEPGGNPGLCNFGENGEPLVKTLEEEIADHQGMPITFLRLLKPDPTPKPKPRKVGHP